MDSIKVSLQGWLLLALILQTAGIVGLFGRGSLLLSLSSLAIATSLSLLITRWQQQEGFHRQLEQKVQDRTAALEQEIADRKQAEVCLSQAEAKHLAVIQAIPDLMYSVREDGIFLDYAPTDFFADLISDAINPTGKHLSQLLPDEVAYRHLHYLRQALSTGKLQTYEQRIWLNRTAQYEEVRVVPVAADRVVFIIRDISDRKKAETALQSAKEAAEAANRAKSTFLAGMSHELRTPLNAILGFTQIMRRDPSLNAEQQRNLEIINRSGEHLLYLINSVLDLSKIEAGHLELTPSSFNLSTLIDTVTTMLQERAQSKGLSLQVEIAPDLPEIVLTDAGKLRQVLINLIGNAIKFTDQGQVILRVRRGSGTRLLFEVTDTGSGIAPEDLKRIFEAFEQTQSSKKLTEGTGLGLTLSRRFVQLMGGDITVTSVLDQGSTFTFDITVQLAEVADLLPARQSHPIIGLQPGQPIYRILIADSQIENQDLLVKLLSPLGFAVETAVTGEDAIARWQTWHPDLILIDERLPVLNGFKAVQQIRLQEAESELVPTQIIALSASAFDNDQDRAIASGCNGFLKKPFREQELLEKLADHLPVSYCYGEAPAIIAPTTAIPLVTPDILSALPGVWLHSLYQATLAGDDAKILELLEELPEAQSQLATGLGNLARRFEFDRILSILDGHPS